MDGYRVPCEFFKGMRVFDKNTKKTDGKFEDKEYNKANGEQDITNEEQQEEKVN